MKALKKILTLGMTVLMGSVCFSGCGFLTDLLPEGFRPSQGSKAEYISEEEYASQVAYYGSNENATANNCMRIGFSVKMKENSTFKFIGDDSVYKFRVCEMESVIAQSDKCLQDSGWLETDRYVTQQDCYPMPMIERIDGAALTNEELLSMHSMIEVEGEKLTPKTSDDAGALSSEEYASQVIHYGSVPSPFYDTRVRMSFSIKMQRDSKVRFVGDSDTYRWAVCEMYNTSHASGYLDSGWNTSWSSPTAEYVMNLDGAYPVLAISRVDGAALTTAEMTMMYSMFEVEGAKWVEHAELTTNDSAVKAINHRGYCMKAPENTLAAYRESALHGFTMVECDVWFTSDNQPVLLHDSTIDRTSNGSGSIENMTLEEVRQYDFGSWRSPEYKGEKIPTFDEFMALCDELDLHPYIELKSGLSIDHALALIEIVGKYDRMDKVSWISFGADTLKNVVSLYGNARVGYLVNDVTASEIASAKTLQTGANEVFIDCSYSAVNETDATLCRSAGMALEVWTLNTPADVASLNSYVSGVSSDWMVVGDYLN